LYSLDISVAGNLVAEVLQTHSSRHALEHGVSAGPDTDLFFLTTRWYNPNLEITLDFTRKAHFDRIQPNLFEWTLQNNLIWRNNKVLLFKGS
jgi:hypothetical protein